MDGNLIKAMVINTGFNTYWGSFLQNILFPKTMNFNFYKELKIFLNILFGIYIITVVYRTVRFINKFQTNQENNDKNHIRNFIERIIDLITVVIPPNLQICMSVTSIYFNEILKKKNITCLSEKRMTAAGKVNVIVLDKTGTLTEDGLDLSGFQTTNVKKNINKEETLEFDNIEKSLKLYNSIHSEFWTRFSIDNKNKYYKHYKTNKKNNPIYFIECLATCLSIDKLRDNNILGNSMDKKIFDMVGWNLDKIDEVLEEEIQVLYFF